MIGIYVAGVMIYHYNDVSKEKNQMHHLSRWTGNGSNSCWGSCTHKRLSSGDVSHVLAHRHSSSERLLNMYMTWSIGSSDHHAVVTHANNTISIDANSGVSIHATSDCSIHANSCVVARFIWSLYNEVMKILVISLYDGSNEIEEVGDEEIAEFSTNMEKCNKGDKVVWLGEEFMYVEL